MTEGEKITLQNILSNQGLSHRQVEDIFLLLSIKSERVQMAFFYRACGMTYKKIGKQIGVTKAQARYYIKKNLDDVKQMFKKV